MEKGTYLLTLMGAIIAPEVEHQYLLQRTYANL